MSLVGLVFLHLLLGTAVLLPAGAEALRWERAGKWAAILILGLLALPAAAVAVNRTLLEAQGLALRGRVLSGCGFLFTVGVVGALAGAGAFLWRQFAGWRPAVRAAARCVVWAAAVFLCGVIGTFGLIFSLFFAGDDTAVEWNGAPAVRESSRLGSGCDYYARHGPFLRGTAMLAGSGTLEQEARWAEKRAEDEALRQKAGGALGLDLSRGTVRASADTHGGFHNNGETYIQFSFSYTNILPEQVEDNPDWLHLPMPEGLYELAGHLQDAPPILPAEELYAGWYRFVDLHSEAEDEGDWSAAAARGSYNFILTVYDYRETCLYFYQLDT